MFGVLYCGEETFTVINMSFVVTTERERESRRTAW